MDSSAAVVCSPRKFGVLRDLSALTLRQLAARSKVNISQIHAFETGTEGLPNTKLVRCVRVMRKEIKKRADRALEVLREEELPERESHSPQQSTLTAFQI